MADRSAATLAFAGQSFLTGELSGCKSDVEALVEVLCAREDTVGAAARVYSQSVAAAERTLKDKLAKMRASMTRVVTALAALATDDMRLLADKCKGDADLTEQIAYLVLGERHTAREFKDLLMKLYFERRMRSDTTDELKVETSKLKMAWDGYSSDLRNRKQNEGVMRTPGVGHDLQPTVLKIVDGLFRRFRAAVSPSVAAQGKTLVRTSYGAYSCSGPRSVPAT